MKAHQVITSSLFASYFILLTGLAALSAPAATLYVNVNNAAPSPPYSSWDTAATNIQDAVNVAIAGDEIAVTNGVYESGQRVWPTGSGETNRLVITKPLNVHSVNGSGMTIIDGGGASRCVYLAADATLAGFTLTNGYVVSFIEKGRGGGGLYCESNSAAVFDCVIAGNRIGHSGGPTYETGAGAHGGTLTRCTLTFNRGSLADGGGAANAILNNCVIATNSCSVCSGAAAIQCTLNDCTLTWNRANGSGGGAADSTLNNCMIVHNVAYSGEGTFGGGTLRCTANNCVYSDNNASGEPDPHFYAYGGAAYGGTLNNCTITTNPTYGSGKASVIGAKLNNCIVYDNTLNFDYTCTLNYCCTTPMPTNGVGNFTNAPLFVDLAGGNLRLQVDSPCINAGNNAYVTNSTDLDGNPRISGGAVDVGAYEFIFTPPMDIARLIQIVEDSNLPARNKQPLLATLDAALSSLERGNVASEVNQLNAFQNKASAQVAKIDADLANELIQAAQEIIQKVTDLKPAQADSTY